MASRLKPRHGFLGRPIPLVITHLVVASTAAGPGPRFIYIGRCPLLFRDRTVRLALVPVFDVHDTATQLPRQMRQPRELVIVHIEEVARFRVASAIS